jgi:hypothetical protein
VSLLPAVRRLAVGQPDSPAATDNVACASGAVASPYSPDVRSAASARLSVCGIGEQVAKNRNDKCECAAPHWYDLSAAPRRNALSIPRTDDTAAVNAASSRRQRESCFLSGASAQEPDGRLPRPLATRRQQA